MREEISKRLKGWRFHGICKVYWAEKCIEQKTKEREVLKRSAHCHEQRNMTPLYLAVESDAPLENIEKTQNSW